MNKNRGIAVVPLIIVLILAGVAGFSIFSWLKTSQQAKADKEVAEQREAEFKSALDDAQQQAEENARLAEELEETLTQTQEAMALAEEKAAADAAEKAAMLAELEAKLEEEEEAKAAALAKSEELQEAIEALEVKIAEARRTESVLRASLGAPVGPFTRLDPRAVDAMANVDQSLTGQRSSLDSIKALLATGATVSSAELSELLESFEVGLAGAESSAADFQRQFVASGEYSSSSAVGQAIADLQQTTQRQRALVNGLKRFIAANGEFLDAQQLQTMVADIEASMVELEQRQRALGSALSVDDGEDTGTTAALAEFERTIQRTQNELANLRRQLAASEAEKQAAIDRQKELERLSIEIRYDIDYQSRSLSYQRRLHSMYDRIANPKQER